MRTLVTTLALAAALTAAGARETAGEVTYLPSAQVSDAFAKGAVLLKHGNYMIHASRREGPGMAEVHGRDADLVYVLDGTATLVTGGTVVDGRTIEPDEIRGAAIRGGTTYHLARGDVVVVPAGTPHWFKDVDAPFLYYVVKVR